MLETKYDLNELYKILKNNDIEFQKRFESETISDDEYFLCGIKSDIVTNAINIIISDYSNNLESADIDNSCRLIIESLVVLEMYKNGEISNLQKRIYRYSYALVDYGNYETILSGPAKEHPFMQKFFEERNIAINAIKELHKCGDETIEKRKERIVDPDFYLQRKINKKVTFRHLLTKYHVGDIRTIEAYDLFSAFIHPRCEMNNQIEDTIMKIRKPYINYVCELAFDYLKKENMFDYAGEITTFQEDMESKDDCIKKLYDLNNIDLLFNKLTEMFCVSDKVSDMFTCHFLKRSKHLFKSMQLSLSCGYRENVIKCFKSLIEQFSIYFKIGSTDDLKEFNSLKKAFWYTSRIQLKSYFEKFGAKEAIIPQETIQDLYDSFYKGKSDIKSADDLYQRIKNNSYFYLACEDKKDYSKYVNLFIETISNYEMTKEEIKSLYKLSLDISHASGYSFNSTRSLLDTAAHKVMFYSWKILLHYIMNANLTLHEHNIMRDPKELIDFVEVLSIIEANWIKSIAEIYEKEVEEDYNKLKNSTISN